MQTTDPSGDAGQSLTTTIREPRHVTGTMRVRVNHRRYNHMMQHAIATIRRARKGDRPAIMQRFADAVSRDCVRLEITP